MNPLDRIQQRRRIRTSRLTLLWAIVTAGIAIAVVPRVIDHRDVTDGVREGIARTTEALREASPAEPDIDAVVRDLRDAMTVSGVEVELLAEEPVATTSEPTLTRVTIAGNTVFTRLPAALYSVGTIQPAGVVEKLNINRLKNEPDGVRFKMTLAYRDESR